MKKMKNYTYQIVKWGIIGVVIVVLFILSIVATPSLLSMFSNTLFILTIGAILDSKKSYFRMGVKWLIYIFYLLVSLYNLGIFDQVFTFLKGGTIKDIEKIIFGVVAPICMVIVAKIITHYKIKGHKFFNYHVYWMIYIVLSLIWGYYFPDEVYLVFLLIYWVLSYVMVYCFKKIAKKKYGGMK